MSDQTASAETEPKTKVAVLKPLKALPTNRMAFGKQLDVLRGWVIASGPEGKAVSNKDVGNIVRMASDTVTLGNAFFAEAGLLERRDGGYAPTAVTVAFNQAYDWAPETAAHKLAPAFEQAWFGQTLLPRLRMASMSETEALTVLGEASRAASSFKPQLQIVLDYMEVAGLIVRDNGQIRFAASRPSEMPAATPKAEAEPKLEHRPTDQGKATPVSTSFSQPTEGQVQFNVSVRVSMVEFAGWDADRITAFFNGIAEVLAAKSGIERGATEP